MNHIKLHFGGLWAVFGEPPSESEVRTAIHFFGDRHMVFLDFQRPNQLSQEMYDYRLLDEQEMSIQLLDGESSQEEQPIVPIRWRLLENRFLRFEQMDRKYSVWEPVTAEQFAKEGFPLAVLESVRQSFLGTGSSYSTEPLVPDASAFRALKQRKTK